MDFIIKQWFKYYTKETCRALGLVLSGTAIVCTIVCIKYKPAYTVTLAGEYLGVVESKELVNNRIDKFLNDNTDNIAFREITALPDYEMKLMSRSIETEDAKVVSLVQGTVNTTYRYYAITVDGETKGILNTEKEANDIINNIKSDLEDGVKLDIGMIEVYTGEKNTSNSVEVSNTINSIKLAKVEEYKKEKAEKEKAIAKQKMLAKARTSVPTSGVSGNIQGMNLVIPVNGTVTSRFGSVSSVRSSAHTGLDISASKGTGIRPIANGTVIFASYKGSYGNLIIIDHGNGVQSYYAHCNAIYVSAGQSVSTGTVIGAVGSTGNSTGSHLHLEMRINGAPINPQSYLY